MIVTSMEQSFFVFDKMTEQSSLMGSHAIL